MPSASKDLSALGSVLELVCSGSNSLDGHGSLRGSFNYKAGTGTIVLEATHDVTNPGVWFSIVDDAQPPVVIPGITTVGVTVFPIHGYERIRARNTASGAGNLVSLAFQ